MSISIWNICYYFIFSFISIYKCDTDVTNKHHTTKEIFHLFGEVHDRCPGITHLYNLTERSVDGRNLGVIVFSDTPGKHTSLKPLFKYVGNMHGNEVTGKELLLQLMEYLCDQSTKNENVKWLIQNTEIHLLPSMNPDGWERANKQRTGWTTGRANDHNVDLNRAFPKLDKYIFSHEEGQNNHLTFDLSKDAEPEVKAVVKWITKNPFVLSANLHNGDLVANYPYDLSKSGKAQDYTACPDDKAFRFLARSYSENHAEMSNPKRKACMGNDHFKHGITNGAEWYSVSGGMQDFNYLASNCFEITLELGCDKFPPATVLAQSWKDNKQALLEFMLKVHSGIKGYVKDVDGNPILDAVIHVDGINHDITTTREGEYWRLLADGEYEVTASKDGFKSETKVITVANIDGQEAKVLNFDLEPEKALESRKALSELKMKIRKLYEQRIANELNGDFN